MVYLSKVMAAPVPQSEALDGQVANSAGGFSFQVSDWGRLRRFLILGSEGGSYYAGERALTLENAKMVRQLIERDGEGVVREVCNIIREHRAPKMGPPLFVLAMASSYGNEETRRFALQSLPVAVRTASQLLEFVGFVDSMRGWGRSLREGLTHWYTSMPIDRLVYQVVKYRQRQGWTHRDLLRKTHPKVTGARDEVFAWLTHETLPPDTEEFRLIHAYEQAKTADVPTLTELIREHSLTWEMVPSEALAEAKVWEALSEDMPLMAKIRNLATLTRYGIIAPMKFDNAVEAINSIGTEGAMPIHPIEVLSALTVYKAGKGARGSHNWNPVSQVVDALDTAFDRSFAQAPQTNKRHYLAIDVSGSMGSGEVAGVPGLTPAVASAAMAMAIARREPNYYIAGFSHDRGETMSSRHSLMQELKITAGDSLTTAMRRTSEMQMGGTDCALPMLDALQKKMPVDVFVVLTDSETWAGSIHPVKALQRYRKEMGIPAKLVVVGMVSNGFTIADPDDSGMLDVVGFDAAAPQLIADFVGTERV